jgi:hypothetical protein
MLYTPAAARSVENEDLCALRPFRSGTILPIAIAGKELAAVSGEHAKLGAAREATRAIGRPRRKAELKIALASRRTRGGDASATEKDREQPIFEPAHHPTSWRLSSDSCVRGTVAT